MSIYRSGIDPSKVGAHASAPLSRNTRFGPVLEDEEDNDVDGSDDEISDKPSSKWMQVRNDCM